MTIKELRQRLECMPDSMEVFVAERKTEFAYGLVNSVYIREITFSEDPDDGPIARDTVVILDEE